MPKRELMVLKTHAAFALSLTSILQVGEDDEEAHRKLHHMLNTARLRHTLRVLEACLVP